MGRATRRSQRRVNPDARMPLRDHLAEFRTRLIWAVVGLAVGAVVGWFLFEPAFEALQQPVLAAAEAQDSAVTINFAGLATALDMRVKVSIFLGLIISSPWWLYQLWAFLSPGLERKEKRYTLGFLGAAVPLFALGIVAAWFVFPHAVAILTDFRPDDTAQFLDAQLYLGFVMRLFIAFGIAFTFPVVMVALTWSGATKTRTWLRAWRWAVLIIFVFAAVMTPTPDAITMSVMALPMCALYFGAIGIGALGGRSRRKEVA
jgi:sec-independent protein translocase protein TatC